MNKLPEQIYRYLKWQVQENESVKVSYSELAYLFVTELPTAYNAVNQLVRDGRVSRDACQRLGGGDYVCRFEVK